MVADALTKLATANVIQVLVNAMDGRLPTRTMAHRTSVTPGPANRGDIAGDGPVHNHHGSNKYLLNKVYLYLSTLVRYYEIYVYVLCDRVGSSNTPTNSDRAMQSIAPRLLSKAMIWVCAIICLSTLRKWLRRKSKNVKGGKTCRSELPRRLSSAHLTTEWTIMSLVKPNTRSLTGELSKTKFLHHVSEAPRTLSEMSQNPAALKNNRVAHSARTLERRSQRKITTSWDGSGANLYSPQGDAGRLSAMRSPQRRWTAVVKKLIEELQTDETGPNTFDSYASEGLPTDAWRSEGTHDDWKSAGGFTFDSWWSGGKLRPMNGNNGTNGHQVQNGNQVKHGLLMKRGERRKKAKLKEERKVHKKH